ncbi:MAG: hypothetical protein KBD16_00525 [Candidatus Pacebacteria bacterium]|nr:hypothetical protein [Candidatus Paceibacterota bacterium]
MDPQVEQLIIERTRALPQVVKEAFARIDVPKQLWAIAKKHALRVDQSGVLETETLLVLLGIEKTQQFIANLVNNGVPRDVALRVSDDVNQEIFKAIRSDLAITREEREATLEATPIAPAKTLGAGIAEAKLSSTMHLAPDTMKITETTPSTPKPPSIVQSGAYTKGTDPYREPVL